MTHGCMNVPNDLTMSDCNDCDPTIHVGQMGFFPTAGPNGFDYNCDGSLEQKWVEGNCSAFVDGLSGECAKHTYLEVSGACGAMVPVVTCKGTGIPTAPCGTNPAVMQPLPCH